jgi:hypothetical protein
MASIDVWVPEGQWIDYQTRELHYGPCWTRLVGDLNRVPMLVRVGGILPLAAPVHNTGELQGDLLVVEVFPGQGAMQLYEDDGESEAYREGSYEWTPLRTWLRGEEGWVMEIGAVEGQCEALSHERAYEVRFVGSNRPARVLLDGQTTDQWSYDETSLITSVNVAAQPRRRPITVEVLAAAGRPIAAVGPEHNRRVATADVRRLLGDACPADPADVAAVVALPSDTPGRADAIARLGGPALRIVEFTTPEEAACQLGRVVVVGPVGDETYDVDLTFTHYSEGGTKQHTASARGVSGSRLADTAFAISEGVTPERWEVEAAVTWRGTTLRQTYRSAALRPSIARWHVFSHDAAVENVSLADVVDERGSPCDLSLWHMLEQRAENLAAPYWVLWAREERPMGQRPVAYVAACLISPDERDVTLQVGSYGPSDVYLNGGVVGVSPVDSDVQHHLFRHGAGMASVHLVAGENWLVAAPQAEHAGKRWYFGAAVMGPDSYPMQDLRLE